MLANIKDLAWIEYVVENKRKEKSMRDFEKELFLKNTKENIASYREANYLPLKYSLLNMKMANAKTDEDARKVKDEVKEKLEVIFSGENLYGHEPKYKNADLRECVEHLLISNVFEEAMIVIIDDKNKAVLDYKTYCESSESNVGSFRMNREVVRYLLDMAARYGTGIGFIHIHNHPRCINVIPSEGDKSQSLNLAAVGKFVGIPMLDAMIVTDFDLYSMVQDSKNNNTKSMLKRDKFNLSEEEKEILDSVDPKFKYLWQCLMLN